MSEVLSNEAMVRMSRLADSHKISFHFSRITGGDEQQFDCIVRDSIDQVVAQGTGVDREQAADDAIRQIEGNSTLMNRTTMDLASEVKLLREQLSQKRRTPTTPPPPNA